MTEEDQYGYNMPDKYRCDSCKAVVFHLGEALKSRQPKSRRMKEWEYNELFEETCNTAFEGYGIKLVDGENALSGPGLKQPDSLAPGGAMIQMGGDGWTKRLSEICRKLVYDTVGEDELYERFRNDGEIPESMCWKEMTQCSLGPKMHQPKSLKKTPEKKSSSTGKTVNAGTAKKGRPKDGSKERLQVQVSPDATVTPTTLAKVNKTAKSEEINLETFMQSMAMHDGLSKDDFSRARPRQEWEKLIVAVAGKIYNKHVQ